MGAGILQPDGWIYPYHITEGTIESGGFVEVAGPVGDTSMIITQIDLVGRNVGEYQPTFISTLGGHTSFYYNIGAGDDADNWYSKWEGFQVFGPGDGFVITSDGIEGDELLYVVSGWYRGHQTIY